MFDPSLLRVTRLVLASNLTKNQSTYLFHQEKKTRLLSQKLFTYQHSAQNSSASYCNYSTEVAYSRAACFQWLMAGTRLADSFCRRLRHTLLARRGEKLLNLCILRTSCHATQILHEHYDKTISNTFYQSLTSYHQLHLIKSA